MLLVAPSGIEAALVERRLTRWGADVVRADLEQMPAVIAQRPFSAVLVEQLSEEAGTDLRAAEPFLAAIVAQVVDSGAFRTVFDTALSNAHSGRTSYQACRATGEPVPGVSARSSTPGFTGVLAQ